MTNFNRNQPEEFEGEMPNEYEEEEYYGDDESEYAEGEEYEEEYEEEETPGAAPKKDWVKTALIGTAAVLVLAGGAYYAAATLAPETVNELVNNLPFVSQGSSEELGATANGETPAPIAPADGEVAPPPTDVTANAGDVAAVPPVPAAEEPMKPRPRKSVKPKTMPMPKAESMAPSQMAAKPKPKPAWKPKPKPKSTWAAKKKWSRYAAAKPRYTRYPRAAAAYYRPRSAAYTRAQSRYAARYAPRYTRGAAYAAKPAVRRGRYAVQVGSFANASNAAQLVSQLKGQGINAYMSGGGTRMSGGGNGFVVRSVAVKQYANARKLVGQYRRAGYPARIIPVGNGMVAVSAGMFQSQGRAATAVADLNRRGLYASVQYMNVAPVARASGGMARVYIGSYGSRQQAASKMRQLQGMGIPASVAVY